MTDEYSDFHSNNGLRSMYKFSLISRQLKYRVIQLCRCHTKMLDHPKSVVIEPRAVPHRVVIIHYCTLNLISVH